MNVGDSLVGRRRSVEVCRRMLGLEMSPLERAGVYRRLGDLLMDLASHKESPLENASLAVESYQNALLLIDPSLHPDQYRELQRTVGEAYISLADDLTDDRREALLKAAQAFEESLRIAGPSSDMRTSCHLRLAECFSSLADIEDRAGNCRMAIREYSEALRAFEPDSIQYANVLSDLSSVFRRLAEVADTEKNCLSAADACRQSLRVFSIQDNPVEYATAQMRLGNAYLTLAETGSTCRPNSRLKEICSSAVSAYEAALCIFEVGSAPEMYGSVKSNLGAAYNALALLLPDSREELCRKGLAACEEALRVRRPGTPQYAATLNNLGNSCMALAGLDSDEPDLEMLKRAISAYELAAAVRSPERQCARALINLGDACIALARLDEIGSHEMAKRAVSAWGELIRLRSIQESPVERARVYASLSSGRLMIAQYADPSVNAAMAIENCEEALKVFTISGDPEDYASVQVDLAVACMILSAGRAGDAIAYIKRAFDACTEALKVYSPDRSPMEYAEVQTVLWSVFTAMADAGQSQDAGTLWEKAAEACRNAMRIYTRERPDEHALANRRLGASLIAAADCCELEEKKASLLDEAVRVYSSAIEIYSPEDSPFEYAGALKDLGYALVSLADLRDSGANLKHAIKAYKKALRVYSRGTSADQSGQPEDGSDISLQDQRLLADECLAAIRRCRIALKALKKGA